MLVFWKKNKAVILYGTALACLLFLLKWMEFKWMIYSNSMDKYIGAIALFFTILGIWLATHLIKPKTNTIIVEKWLNPTPVENGLINELAIENLGISAREMEVLNLMAKGMSNAEIAADLYLSIPTIKTHIANLFFKLEVKRRTQAIEKAKRLQLIV
ncbi:MAG: LuxR C-terminal-related transcriptional regulator [Sphingobacteriia bacterium]|jgi:DNA-binding CsgD family transcriptional regulator